MLQRHGNQRALRISSYNPNKTPNPARARLQRGNLRARIKILRLNANSQHT